MRVIEGRSPKVLSTMDSNKLSKWISKKTGKKVLIINSGKFYLHPEFAKLQLQFSK